MARATTSLPVPLSPRIKTGKSVRATRVSVSRNTLIDVDSPMMRAPCRAWPSSSALLRRMASRSRHILHGGGGLARQGLERLGILGRELALLLVHHLKDADTASGGIKHWHAQEIAGLKAGFHVHVGAPRGISVNVVHLHYLTAGEHLADDADVVRQAQFATRQAKSRPTDKLLAAFVPQKNAGPLAPQQLHRLLGDVLQERHRLALQRQLLANGHKCLQALLRFTLFIKRSSRFKCQTQVITCHQPILQLGALKLLAIPSHHKHTIGPLPIPQTNRQKRRRAGSVSDRSSDRRLPV